MNVHGPTCRAQTCSSHNDVQLQLCFSVPSVSVCLSTLSFASTSLVCQACSERYQRHWAWNPRFLQLSNKPHDTEKKQRKIWWSFCGSRGCSCLDFRRKGMQFDQFWGKCSQRTSLLDICLRWITYLGLSDLPQVMPHLEWWILIHKGRWNMLGLEHDVCIGFETSLRDICLQADERPWAHMFPLSLSAYLPYLLLPHRWYVRPVRKGTSSFEPGIPDSFNCPASHMIQKRNKGKSGGVFLVLVDAAVLIFGE